MKKLLVWWRIENAGWKWTEQKAIKKREREFTKKKKGRWNTFQTVRVCTEEEEERKKKKERNKKRKEIRRKEERTVKSVKQNESGGRRREEGGRSGGETLPRRGRNEDRKHKTRRRKEEEEGGNVSSLWEKEKRRKKLLVWWRRENVPWNRMRRRWVYKQEKQRERRKDRKRRSEKRMIGPSLLTVAWTLLRILPERNADLRCRLLGRWNGSWYSFWPGWRWSRHSAWPHPWRAAGRLERGRGGCLLLTIHVFAFSDFVALTHECTHSCFMRNFPRHCHPGSSSSPRLRIAQSLCMDLRSLVVGCSSKMLPLLREREKEKENVLLLLLVSISTCRSTSCNVSCHFPSLLLHLLSASSQFIWQCQRSSFCFLFHSPLPIKKQKTEEEIGLVDSHPVSSSALCFFIVHWTISAVLLFLVSIFSILKIRILCCLFFPFLLHCHCQARSLEVLLFLFFCSSIVFGLSFLQSSLPARLRDLHPPCQESSSAFPSLLCSSFLSSFCLSTVSSSFQLILTETSKHQHEGVEKKEEKGGGRKGRERRKGATDTKKRQEREKTW